MGHVEDEHTKEKLEAATVTLVGTGKKLLTDENGNFTFSSLCMGEYTLEISHVDCSTVTRRFYLNRNMHVDILLPHALNTLETVTVSAKRSTPDVAFRQDISGRQLAATRGNSLADALEKINGVTILKTGSNVGKPVIHGLHGNRVLLVNNGIRQEGQQWGNEHAPEVDPFIADKLTVIKGVDELKYGSDAIGGVVIVDARPLKHFPGMAAEFFTGYSTNGRKYYGSANFEQQLDKVPLGYRIQASYKRSANIHTPGYTLNNTGLKEYNFSFTAGLKKEHYFIEGYASHFYTKAGVFSGSHIGNLQDLQLAIAADKPDPVFLGEETYSIARPMQEVAHSLFKLKSGYTKGKNKLYLTAGAQVNNRQEFDKSRSNSNPRPQLDLLIYTFTEELAWDHAPVGKLKGTVGISLMQQDNSYGGRYFIPNYTSDTKGAYWIEKWQQQKWEFHAGLRFDHKQIDTRRLLYSGETVSHHLRYSTFASSGEIIYKPTSLLKFIAGAGLSERAPQVNELLSNGIHHGTATYEEGNPNLDVERSFNASLGFEWKSEDEKFRLNGSVYRNDINNYIYRKPEPDKPVLTIAGAFPKIIYSQTNALLRGIDAGMEWKFLQPLQWNVQASMLRATEKASGQWLIFMPSDRLTNELVYTFRESKRFHQPLLSTELVYVAKQTRVPTSGNGKLDYKDAPGDYALWNATLSSQVKFDSFTIEMGITVENILDLKYRDYMNSFRYFTDEMGRNISLRLKIPIGMETGN